MPETTEQAAREQPNKSDAVRQILQKRGKKTSPTDISAQVKERFGLEITPADAAKIKSRVLAMRRKKKGGRKRAKKGVTLAEPAAPPTSATSVAAANGVVVRVEDIRAVEGLIERIGEEELLRMIGVMAR
jgi:phage gp16-like protein